ncbi:SLBB domain-containing protein [Bacteroidota bacterium]
MKLFRLILLLTIFSAITLNSTFAQNVSTVNVSSLSDAQITQIMNEINNRGLSESEAIALAQTKGATPTQIADMRRRMQELRVAKGGSVSTEDKVTQETPIAREAFSEKAALEASPEEKKVFGYYLFNNKNLTFEPSLNIQTPKQYVVGIGDEILISIWGASESSYQLTVNKNGMIQIPLVGPVNVNGFSLAYTETLIKRRLTSIYSGLAGNNPNTFASITLGGLRSIKVTLNGEINVPGTYTLPATSSLFNALYLSGGPNMKGSFRTISVRRGNKVIQTIDVYDFLVDADPKDNITLQDQDIIYVPIIENRVTVSGAFMRTGYFEFHDNETISDLLRYTGGFTDGAYRFKVGVTRNTLKEKKIIDVNQDQYSQFVLQSGDIVTAGSILNRFENRVTISGEVFRPGTFELTEGLTLFDLIKNAEGLRENAYMNRAHITRLNPDLSIETISFDLGEIITGRKNIDLQREDAVNIKSIFDMREGYNIGVFGEVLKPGTIPFSDNLTLKDLIYKAGGFNESADVSYIELSRRLSYFEASSLTDSLVHIYYFKVPRDLVLFSEDADFLIKPFDRVYIRRAPGLRDQGNVTVEGEVKYAGSFPIAKRTETISDIIERAGGFTPYAEIENAYLIRTESALGTQQVYIELDKILKKKHSDIDLELLAGDRIVVPRQQHLIKVSGTVRNPYTFAQIKGKNLRFYIDKSGGFDDDALKKRIYVRYADGSSARTRSFIFKNYPRIKPGSEIIVPKKPEKPQRQDNTGKWLAIASTTATLGVALSAILNSLK